MKNETFNPETLNWGDMLKPIQEIQAWAWCRSRGIYRDVIKQEQMLSDTMNTNRAVVLYDPATMEVLACEVVSGGNTPEIRRFR